MEKLHKQNKDKKLEELKKWFHEQLKIRDNEIQRLKEQNQTLFNSLLKQGELNLIPKVSESTELFGKAYKSKIKFNNKKE
jgi:hypothetical protein